MKYYVVADIHGFYRPLCAALEAQGFFEDTTPHKLVVCGDLFDRGSEAEQLQAWLVQLLEADRLILIRGNHEDLLEELTAHFSRYCGENRFQTIHWRNGTLDTVYQLTGIDPDDAAADPARVTEAMYNTPFFTKLLPAMRDYYETEHYLFVHGWIPAALYGDRKSGKYEAIEHWRDESELLWAQARWHNGMRAAACGVTEPGKTIVCGHWHASYGHAVLEKKGSEFEDDADFSPYRAEGILAIDACTAHSGKVNCVVLEEPSESEEGKESL